MENANRKVNQEKVDYAAKELAYLLIEHAKRLRKLNKQAIKTKNKNGKSN